MKKKKHPLVNPSPKDFVQTEIVVKQPKKTKSRDQLSLDVDPISVRLKQSFGSLMHFIRRRKDFIEVDMLWKSPALPFTIISGIFVVLIPIVIGIIKFNDIPPKIPFFYNNIDKHWEPFDKSIIFILPLLIGVIEAIVLKLIIAIFKNDKRLGKTLAWVLSFVNVLFYIGFIQIYFLAT
jgi:hypothetical protein